MTSALTAFRPSPSSTKVAIAVMSTGLPGATSLCWAGPPTLEPRTRSQLFPVTRGCDPRASPWTGFKGGLSKSCDPTERLSGSGRIPTVKEKCLWTLPQSGSCTETKVPAMGKQSTIITH